MSKVVCNFHQNMVLCKRNEGAAFWDAFGFLGGGWTGKSSVSFILARLLVEKDGFIVKKGTSLKVIDDNFRLEDGVVSSYDWGGDKSGKCCEFIEYLEKFGHSHQEARPRNQAFKLGSFIGWLLVSDDVPTYVIENSNRDEFINKLLSLNPCHSPSQDEINANQELREQIRDRFNPSWKYSIARRRNTQSPEDIPLLEKLGQKAYDVWHLHPMIFYSENESQ